MGTRLGTDYQHEVAPIDTYQILAGDDLINPLIATDKTLTLPLISSLGPDDKKKIIGNQSGSAGLATYAAASGNTVRGTAVMNPGQYVEIYAQGGVWTIGVGGTATSQSSTADSKAVSAASAANSKDLSQSANLSTGQSTAGSATLSGVSATASVATSQNTSQSANLSLTTSTANSG